MKKKNILLLFPLLVTGLLMTSCDVDDNGDPTDDDSTSDVYYNVTFDLNYQDAPSAPSAQSIRKGGLASKPTSDPTRDGYDFTFWSDNMYGSSEWIFTEHTVTSDLTLYASWTPAASVQKVYYVQIPVWWTSDGGVAGIYMWDDDENRPADWPGQLMGNVHDRTYSFLIPDEYSNFIFVRVSPALADWGAKTIDLNKDMAGSHNLYTINEEPITWGDPGCQGVWSTYNG